jgi:small subunit ribosomal protein S7
MPRRKKTLTKNIEQDPLYKNRIITKLINRSMRQGKKSVAQKQVYKAFELIKEKSKDDPVKIFSRALENIKPNMEVRPRRVGGAAYQIPMPVRGPRKESLAIRWLIFAARARSNSEFHTYADKLAKEIMDAAGGEGAAVKKRTDMERMAEANRAFAHFRW